MKSRAGSQATRIVDLVGEIDAWTTTDGEPFVTVEVGDHFENWPARSASFQRNLAARFFEAESAVAGRESIKAAVEVIAARAVQSGQERAAPVRVARDDGGVFLYLDLADADRHAIEIKPSGWQLIQSHECPVRFRRSPIMRPLPIPERAGDLGELREFVNLATEDDFVLLVAWLVGTLRGDGPYPLLALHGEQGSGKTGAARLLRSIVDPSAAAVRAEPRDPRDLMIATRSSLILAFDNLSRIPPWLSDALCRLATGGSYATRVLYSDAEEAVFDASRPLILTGIEELAERGDLIERSLILHLPRILESRRRTEAAIGRSFEAAHPRILGAVLNAVCEGLQNESAIKLPHLPRMADFAQWVVACEPLLPWAPGRFLRAYQGNRSAANETALEASPVAAAVLRLMEGCERIQVPAADLLLKLEALTEPKVREARSWPKNARLLSGHLKRLAPNLRAVGIDFESGQESGRGSRRWLRLSRVEPENGCDASAASDAPMPARCDARDAGDANAPSCDGGAAIEELF